MSQSGQPGDYDPALHQNLDQLVALAAEIGTKGIWIVRGARNTRVSFALGETAPLDIPETW